MLRRNPNMLNPFMQYYACRQASHAVIPSCLAHQIVYAEAKEKIIEVYYLDSGNKPKSFILPASASLSQIISEHGDGFIKVNRNYLVNTVALTGVFPVGPKEFGCSVTGFGGVIPVSRRSAVTAVRVYKSMNNGA